MASKELQHTITVWFLGAFGIIAVIQAAFMLGVWGSAVGRGSDDVVQIYTWVGPASLATVLSGVGLYGRFKELDWSWAKPSLGASWLLLLAPVLIIGEGWGSTSQDDRKHVDTAALWCFLGVLIRASATGPESREWWFWAVMYVGMATLLMWWAEETGGNPDTVQREFIWWREVLSGLHHVIASSLFLLPSALSALDIVCNEERAHKLLKEAQQQGQVEENLLHALVPQTVLDRLNLGETVIADSYRRATVLFLYVCDYEEMLLTHGAVRTIEWINHVLTRCDSVIIRSDNSVIKVETFNNSLLLFSGTPDQRSGPSQPPATDPLASPWPTLQRGGSSLRTSSGPVLSPLSAENRGAGTGGSSAGGRRKSLIMRGGSKGGPMTQEESLEEEVQQHTEMCIEVALKMVDICTEVTRPDGAPTTVKVGLSSGKVAAGVIGSDSPRYSIFGDAVNTASRMASSSLPCTARNTTIHLSPPAFHSINAHTRHVLEGVGLELKNRDQKLEIKGKGTMQTYFLRKSESHATEADSMGALAGAALQADSDLRHEQRGGDSGDGGKDNKSAAKKHGQRGSKGSFIPGYYG